jgi:YD repeat-containing protein
MQTEDEVVARRESPAEAPARPAESPPPGPDAPEAEARLRWPHWLTIGVWSGFISLLGGGLGLVWSIHPGWRPDPAEKQVAAVEIVALDRAVPIKSYADRIGREVPANIGAPDLGLPTGKGNEARELGCLPGNVYYLQENLEGFKDRATSIVMYTYDAHGQRLAGAYPTVSGGSPAFNIKHGRTLDQGVVPVWSQWPYRSGQFFVRFEIFHDKTLLALVDTKPFRVTQRRYSALVASCFNRSYRKS